jgi:hypothetical protein
MTATATSKPRKPRTKPVRKIRLVLPMNEQGMNGIVRITSGKLVDEYFLDQLTTDFGEGYELTKRTYGEEDTRYHINLAFENNTCDCKGHLQHGHCKHVDGLIALKQAGKL